MYDLCKDDMRISNQVAWELGYCDNCRRVCKFDPCSWARKQDDYDTIMDFIKEFHNKLTDEEVNYMTLAAENLKPQENN